MTKEQEDSKESQIQDLFVIEAALFSAGRPLSEEEIHEATEIGLRKVRAGLKALIKFYKDKEGSLEVAQVGKRYAMQLRRDYAEFVMKLAQVEIPIKLIKTVALIAYHQPIKQSELHDMIGDKVYEHVRELREQGMVRAREHERTKLLSTTEKFVEYFGLDVTDPAAIKHWLAKQVGLDPDREGEKLEDWIQKGEGEESEKKESPGEELEIKPREVDTSLLSKVQRVISDGREGKIEGLEEEGEELEIKAREIDTGLLGKVQDVIADGRKEARTQDEEEEGGSEEEGKEEKESEEEEEEKVEEEPAEEELKGEGPEKGDGPSDKMRSKMIQAAKMGADKLKQLERPGTGPSETDKGITDEVQEEKGEEKPEKKDKGKKKGRKKKKRKRSRKRSK